MREPREECFRCMKPKRMCLCERIPRLDNRTAVLVVQHPRERAHPIGTARFVELGLSSSEVVVAHGLDASRAMRAIGGRRVAMLHPSATSRSLDSFSAEEKPELLVVVDGTWPMARTLVRANPQLAALPHVHLDPASPSRYRIRREPSASCVSTIEATLLALAALEPELDSAPLLAAFDAMIDDQLAAHGNSHAGARKRGNRRAYIGVPVELGERFESLVLVYAESSLRDPSGVRSILRISAVHAASGETFDSLVRPAPRARIPDGLPELLGCADAESMDVIAPRFAAWLETLDTDDERAIVGAFSGELAHRVATLVGRGSFDLGAAYRAMRGKGKGMLDAILRHESIAFEPLAQVARGGRSATRLGHALALALWLRERAETRAIEKRVADSPSVAAACSAEC